MSQQSSNQSLQQHILQGATLKLIQKKQNEPDERSSSTTKGDGSTPTAVTGMNRVPDGYCTYYVREGQRSGENNFNRNNSICIEHVSNQHRICIFTKEIDAITNVLMNSFHHDSQPTFDSYIRRYKCNHLKMCFDSIAEADRGLFVACAVPAQPQSASSSAATVDEEIVGFCSVDGRTPDPSCRIDFLTPSTLASTSPRPYLSDLGVSVAHRRRGVGDMLVRACEKWTYDRGYKLLYLKVEKDNVGGIGLYKNMGYRKTKLPWDKHQRGASAESRWDKTLLYEKSLDDATLRTRSKKRKRRWIKKQLWEPIKSSVGRYPERTSR